MTKQLTWLNVNETVDDLSPGEADTAWDDLQKNAKASDFCFALVCDALSDGEEEIALYLCPKDVEPSNYFKFNQDFNFEVDIPHLLPTENFGEWCPLVWSVHNLDYDGAMEYLTTAGFVYSEEFYKQIGTHDLMIESAIKDEEIRSCAKEPNATPDEEKDLTDQEKAEDSCGSDCKGCDGGCHGDKHDDDHKILDDLGLVRGAGLEAWEKAFKEKLGLSIDDMRAAITSWVESNLDDFASQFTYIAPYGDYGKIVDEQADIKKFLAPDATKLDNWDLWQATVHPETKLLQMVFNAKFGCEDDDICGQVYISSSGKIRHAFAQNN